MFYVHLKNVSAIIGWSVLRIFLGPFLCWWCLILYICWIPINSINCGDSVEVSDCNCVFVYSFHFCQFLLYVFWSSVVRSIHIKDFVCVCVRVCMYWQIRPLCYYIMFLFNIGSFLWVLLWLVLICKPLQLSFLIEI